MKTTKTKKAKQWKNIRVHIAVYLMLKQAAKKRGKTLSEVIAVK